jgi:hypothetical protein
MLEQFADNLKRLRTEKGISQEQQQNTVKDLFPLTCLKPICKKISQAASNQKAAAGAAAFWF